jgi:hypothetical protein
MTKIKTYVVTMVGGIDLVGELSEPTGRTDFCQLEHPYFLRMQTPTQCNLVPMLKNSNILAGTSIMVNLKNVLWICDPSQRVAEEYSTARSGIIKATSFRDNAVNQ